MIPFQLLPHFLFPSIAEICNLFSIFPVAYFFSHSPLSSSNQVFATTTPPKLLSSKFLLIFLLLNSMVSFQLTLYLIQPKYCHMQHPSSLMHCLLMAPRMPCSLVSPRFTWVSLSASFTDSSSTSSCWRALGRSQRALLLFPSALPPSVILPICDFKCIQKLICYVLQLSLHFCTPGSCIHLPSERQALSRSPCVSSTTDELSLYLLVGGCHLCALHWDGSSTKEVFWVTIVAVAPRRINVLGCTIQ